MRNLLFLFLFPTSSLLATSLFGGSCGAVCRDGVGPRTHSALGARREIRRNPNTARKTQLLHSLIHSSRKPTQERLHSSCIFVSRNTVDGASTVYAYHMHERFPATTILYMFAWWGSCDWGCQWISNWECGRSAGSVSEEHVFLFLYYLYCTISYPCRFTIFTLYSTFSYLFSVLYCTVVASLFPF